MASHREIDGVKHEDGPAADPGGAARLLGTVAARLAAVGATTLLASGLAQAAEAKLVVFVHVAAKQRAFQDELQAAVSGIAVTAVGRISDFDRALQDGQDAALTLPLILAAHGLSADLRGMRQGSPDEKYALVGADVVPDPGAVKAVGALDLLGRDGTIAFIQGLVGGQPKVERVIKVEDLLALLQMQRVDAIVLPTRLFNELKAVSRMNLAKRELATAIGLPAVAKLGPAGAQVLSAMSRLPSSILKTLGVDTWR